MKKILLGIITFIFIHNLNAQVQKGTLVTGGSISFNGTNNAEEFSARGRYVTDEYKRNFFAARPQIGVFTSETMLLGMGLGYEYTSFKIVNSFEGRPAASHFDKRNMFFINPFFTHFNGLAEKLYLTTTLNLLAGVGKESFGENGEVETSIVELNANITPGLTYFISDKWALNGSIGQLFYKRSQEKLITDVGLHSVPKNVDNSYGFSISFNTFSIGLQYFLSQ